MKKTERRLAAQLVANSLDLQFTATDEWGMLPLLKGFELFRKGVNKKITNVMQRKGDMLEYHVRIFDYQYTISSGKTSVTYNQSVFFLESKELGLPEFWMRPEHLFHRIGEWFGRRDIDFEEYPEFSRRYFLTSPDEDYLRASLGDAFLRFFSVEKKWILEGVGYFLIFYQHNNLFEPLQMRQFYEQGTQLAEWLKKRDWADPTAN
ncbi:MAG: hypothetical protein H6555_04060 [Lewinellaceae bacterium]|nr:hypothetical protein [Lewinellaceae bacterium]